MFLNKRIQSLDKLVQKCRVINIQVLFISCLKEFYFYQVEKNEKIYFSFHHHHQFDNYYYIPSKKWCQIAKRNISKNQTCCPIFIYLAKFETESFFIFPSGNIFFFGELISKHLLKKFHKCTEYSWIKNQKSDSWKDAEKKFEFFKCRKLS